MQSRRPWQTRWTSRGVQLGGRTGLRWQGWWLSLLPLLLLGKTRQICRRKVAEYARGQMSSHWQFEILRRPRTTHWCNREISWRFELTHPTWCIAVIRTIPANMSQVLHIRRIPDFHFTFLDHKEVGNVFESFAEPFHSCCHCGRYCGPECHRTETNGGIFKLANVWIQELNPWIHKERITQVGWETK